MEPTLDIETDLPIAGAGPAGMTVALVASIEGLTAIVCEKTGRLVVRAQHLRAHYGSRKFAKPKGRLRGFLEDAATYLDQLIGDDRASEHRRIYLQDGPRVIDYLENKTDVKFLPCRGCIPIIGTILAVPGLLAAR